MGLEGGLRYCQTRQDVHSATFVAGNVRVVLDKASFSANVFESNQLRVYLQVIWYEAESARLRGPGTAQKATCRLYKQYLLAPGGFFQVLNIRCSRLRKDLSDSSACSFGKLPD